MSSKRKAHEAFHSNHSRLLDAHCWSVLTLSLDHLSAVAAAKIARQQVNDIAATTIIPDLANDAGAVPYDGNHPRSASPSESGESIHYNDLATTANGIAPILSDIQSTTPFSVLRDPFHATTKDKVLELRLSLNDKVTLVGEYDVEVTEGITTVYGTILRPDRGVHRVFAPSTHPLPQIQARQDGTVVKISNTNKSIRKLERLSPLFRNIWNDERVSSRTFTPLINGEDDSMRRSLHPLEMDKQADGVMSALIDHDHPAQAPRIMALGSKSSGKSTFNRVLCNRFLNGKSTPSCQYLDLDPGQPEFSPPGQLSLVEVYTPLLGPPFTHLASERVPHRRIVRSHTLAATSFKEDSDLYIAICRDLISHIDRRRPLVVNTCGWVTGQGAPIQEELVKILSITDIVIFEPLDVPLKARINALSTPSTSFKTPTLHFLPRQPPWPTSRSPAEFRAMQTMAYFHIRHDSTNHPSFRYSSKPLSRVRPWLVRYAPRSTAGISGIASYGPSVEPRVLPQILDGSLVAIVLVTSPIPLQPSTSPLPLLPTTTTTPTLLPSSTRSLGLALIRALDPDTQTLQLVLPQSGDVEEALKSSRMAGESDPQIVLVRGGFDTPGWAYLEDVYRSGDGEDVVQERPWVAIEGCGIALGAADRDGESGVGVRGAVWRVRHAPVGLSGGSRGR